MLQDRLTDGCFVPILFNYQFRTPQCIQFYLFQLANYYCWENDSYITAALRRLGFGLSGF